MANSPKVQGQPADAFRTLFEERRALLDKVVDWRSRWNAFVLSERGSIEHAMAGIRPLDEAAEEILAADQSAPSELGGGIRPER